MAHFSDRVTTCSDPYCRQCDFLPVTCDACEQIFCSEHLSYTSHACTGVAKKDRRVIICPLCSKSVTHPAGEDENDVFQRHVDSGACQPVCGKMPEKPRCPVKGCKERLTSINSCTCSTCKQRVCLKHRFEDAHDCRVAPPPAPAPTGRPNAVLSTCRDVARRTRFLRGAMQRVGK
eukprot:gnl/TRDRNA2_/TRDRNA2_179124_c0_seq1.p1 gnl/TRDRNA2_/TRDRNA2_179124_c0~~gnl/TRDRNA2_/TRDRNA2_179124_c0_seq1.p1  ORF type:complete len:176 (-),score=28.16 gnl/TRDRNA2_/TRDRNA2_179124_c0_seq1:200-727(-)